MTHVTLCSLALVGFSQWKPWWKGWIGCQGAWAPFLHSSSPVASLAAGAGHSYSWLGTKSALSLPALGVSHLLLVFLNRIYSLVPLQNSPQIIQWNDLFSAETLIHVP